jgi:hypothetical protein
MILALVIPDTRIGPDDAGPIVGGPLGDSGCCLDGLQVPAAPATVEDDRCTAAVFGSEDERDTGPAFGGIGGSLVADGVEPHDAMVVAAPANLARSIRAAVPAHVRLDGWNLDECH